VSQGRWYASSKDTDVQQRRLRHALHPHPPHPRPLPLPPLRHSNPTTSPPPDPALPNDSGTDKVLRNVLQMPLISNQLLLPHTRALSERLGSKSATIKTRESPRPGNLHISILPSQQPILPRPSTIPLVDKITRQHHPPPAIFATATITSLLPRPLSRRQRYAQSRASTPTSRASGTEEQRYNHPRCTTISSPVNSKPHSLEPQRRLPLKRL